MRNIAGLPRRDREALFRNTAGKMGVNIAIVEKDFWEKATILHQEANRAPEKGVPIDTQGTTTIFSKF